MNPYAPPQVLPPQPGGFVPPGRQALPWEVGEVVEDTWERYKQNGVVLGGAWLVLTGAGLLLGQIPNALARAGVVEEQGAAFWGVVAFATFAGWLAQAFFGVGYTRMLLRAARGERAQFSELFVGTGAPKLFAVEFILRIVVMVGSMFFVAPGVIAWLAWMFAPFFLVDQQVGVIESLRRSTHATNGHKGKLFVIFLLYITLPAAGCLACCVGALIAAPLCQTIIAVIYTRLTGTTGVPVDGPPLATGAAPPA